MGPGWPFVARTAEVDAAVAALGPGARGLVITGPAGIGKTRLARELLSRNAQRGPAARWVVGTATAQRVPLGAFGTLLGPSTATPDVLADAANRLLGGHGHRRLVVVDDAHLLDELSALLVHHLVVHTDASVLLTVRTGERGPDAIGALWRDEYLPALELAALSPAATAAVLSAALGGELDSGASAALGELAGGNPLHLRHLVEGERAAGRLASSNGRWTWTGEVGLTAELIDLVEHQVGVLPAGLVEVVDLVALAEPLPAPLLVELVDATSVETAEQRGLIVVDGSTPPSVHLGHPLYGEVRRDRMGRLRARRQRTRIAGALARYGDTPADRLRRAVLLLDTDAPPDPELLTDGAMTALSLIDVALAERLAYAAVTAGGGWSARLTLAYALSFLHRGAEAETELAALSDDPAAPTLVVALCRASNLLWEVGDVGRARTVLAEAERRVGPEAEAAASALRSTIEGASGRPQQARQRSHRALASPNLDPMSTLAATYGLVGALGVLGGADELGAVAERGYAAFRSAPSTTFLRFGLAQLHLNGLWLAGRTAEAEALAAEGDAETRRGPSLLRPYGASLVGQAALARGRLRTATGQLREALAGRSADPHRYVLQLLLVVALAKSGEPAAAYDVLTAVQEHPHPAFTFLAPEALLAAAWVAAAEGSRRRSLQGCLEAARQAAEFGQPAHEVLALQTAVGFGDATGAGRLAELAGQVDGPRAAVATGWAHAWAARDPDALLAASADLEAIGDEVAAADAAAQAASVAQQLGRSGTAAVASGRAYALAERCEGARTPAVLSFARPLPLTARQLETVALASTGLSNRQIADRLVVSVRTVEGHLYRACERLGATSRRELAEVYAQVGATGGQKFPTPRVVDLAGPVRAPLPMQITVPQRA